MKKQFVQSMIDTFVIKSVPKKHRLMFSFFLTGAALFGTSNTYGQDEKVTLNMNKVSLSKAFQLIENQTKYQFFYNSKDFNINDKVSISTKDTPLSSVLQKLLSDKNLSYTVVGNQIVLKKEAITNSNTSTSNSLLTKAANQSATISGIVRDETGVPLIGVAVVIEGTQKGTLTDLDGQFTLDVEKDQKTLIFSLIGLKTKKVILTGQNNLSIVMQEDNVELGEIVMIGYGSQRAQDVTGAVSSVNTNELNQSSIGEIGIDKALGGLIKGVQVSQPSGRPGAAARLNIRGITSPLSSYGLNQPLYVVDGVPFNMDAMQGANPLQTIAASEIESIDILKDAAATSIFGSRGANGVVIIQTKRGTKDKDPKITFSTSTTIATPIKKVNSLNAQQYKSFYNSLMQNSVDAMNKGELDPFFAFDLENIANVEIDYDTFEVKYNGMREDYFGTADTDWNKEVFRNPSYTYQANFGLSGGSDRSVYNMRLSAIDQQGLVFTDKMKQYTFGLSLDSDISKKVKMGGTINVAHTNSDAGEDLTLGLSGINTYIAKARPDLPVYGENGKLLGQPNYQYGFMTLEPNPVMTLQKKGKQKAYNLIANSYLEVKPVENLTLKADVNAAVFNSKSSMFTPKIADTDFVFFSNDSYLREYNGTVESITTNLTADYKLYINDHNLGFLVGTAWDYTDFTSDSQMFAGFPDDHVLTNPSSARQVIGYTGVHSRTGLNSVFARATYNYLNRYTATANFRSDASSKFGPGNKRAYFPSLSVGWTISNENFMAEFSKLDFLRLRASAGSVGSTNVSSFAYLQFFQTSSSSIYNGQSAIVPSDNFPNVNIGWETTNEVNTGVDFAFFSGRLNGSVDVYNRKTKNALVRTPMPLELGSSIYYSNFIDVSNKGIEVSIGGDIIRTPDFTWNLNFNWALNRNKLDKLNGATIDPYLQDYFIEGEPVGTIKGYKVVKIIQSQDEINRLNASSPTGFYDRESTGIGDYLFEDVNGDGYITSDDRTVIGNIQPKFFGGFVNTFSYKNFSLSAIFQYSVGAKSIWSPVQMGAYNTLGENKYSEYALNTWTPENTEARFARAVYSDPSGSSRISDRYLYDTSYLRLKNIMLSYSFDQQLVKRMGMDNLVIYVSASNLFTITKWPGQDPETLSERGSIIDQTSAEDPYPLAKAFSFGVQFKF